MTILSQNLKTLHERASQPYFNSVHSEAKALFSLRKLRDVENAKAIRVRRTPDSLEMDIGFVGQDLDTTTLLNFVGAGHGYVVKWYDQSPSGFDAVQSNASYQPTIVLSGVVQVNVNGTPKIIFGNSTIKNLSLGGNYIFAASVGLVANVVAEASATEVSRFVFDFGQVGNSNYGIRFGTDRFVIMAPGYQRSEITSIVGLQAIRALWDFSVPDLYLKRNTVDVTTSITSSTKSPPTGLTAANIDEAPTPRTAAGPFMIGSQAKSSSQATRFFKGSISEIAIYTGTTAIDIQEDQMSYYGV